MCCILLSRVSGKLQVTEGSSVIEKSVTCVSLENNLLIKLDLRLNITIVQAILIYHVRRNLIRALAAATRSSSGRLNRVSLYTNLGVLQRGPSRDLTN